MRSIKLVAFDLDFTLLDKDKCISDENLEALREIKKLGIIPIVATGRLYDNVPEQLKEICRYYILTNGATIYDSQEDRYFYDTNISKELALKIYEYGDKLPCVYDAYIDNHGYMSKDMYDRLDNYIFDKKYLVTMKEKRTPIESLVGYIKEENRSVQKIQFYFNDLDERDRQIKQINDYFPGKLYVSKSLVNNIEINCAEAIKGNALRKLCEYLDVPVEEAVAFGDGTNDVSMIKDAGIGICMCNGDEMCKQVADIITEYDCDNSGFARELRKIINYQEMR